jgi:putative endonuclease
MADPDPRQATGRQGETLARAELERRGYEILAERFRTRCGEIDLVARHGSTLVFVEVRTRRRGTSGTAAESVDRRKQLQVARMAAAYLATHEGSNGPCRFDVVALDYDGATEPRIVVYENAFEVN